MYVHISLMLHPLTCTSFSPNLLQISPNVEWRDDTLLPSKTYANIILDEKTGIVDLSKTLFSATDSAIIFYVQHSILFLRRLTRMKWSSSRCTLGRKR